MVASAEDGAGCCSCARAEEDGAGWASAARPSEKTVKKMMNDAQRLSKKISLGPCFGSMKRGQPVLFCQHERIGGSGWLARMEAQSIASPAPYNKGFAGENW
jgi:hypothetical protein